jgi:glycosyltransferase involved in cell wall biosynthesis
MHEPFGIVVLEAWSAGRTVIASRVGGLQALVRDGKTGLFMDPNAPAAAVDLAAQLSRLAGDPGFCAALGEAGRREARALYDWTQIGQQLETLYQRAEEHCAHRS